MTLTARATAWLATLSRETPIPTTEVEQLILDAGGTLHAVWLDFHDKYAGYAENVGPGDMAVWGLARAAAAQPPSVWRQPNTVFISPGVAHLPESINCADANPTHNYAIGADGRFRGLGGPSETFDMKIERHGIKMEFDLRGKVVLTFSTKESEAPENQQLLQDVARFLVPEASGASAKFYLTPNRLLEYSPFIKTIVQYEIDPPSSP